MSEILHLPLLRASMLSAKDWLSLISSGLMQWVMGLAGGIGMPGISMEEVISQFPGWMFGWSAAIAARPPASAAPTMAEAHNRVLKLRAAWVMRRPPFLESRGSPRGTRQPPSGTAGV